MAEPNEGGGDKPAGKQLHVVETRDTPLPQIADDSDLDAATIADLEKLAPPEPRRSINDEPDDDEKKPEPKKPDAKKEGEEAGDDKEDDADDEGDKKKEPASKQIEAVYRAKKQAKLEVDAYKKKADDEIATARKKFEDDQKANQADIARDLSDDIVGLFDRHGITDPQARADAARLLWASVAGPDAAPELKKQAEEIRKNRAAARRLEQAEAELKAIQEREKTREEGLKQEREQARLEAAVSAYRGEVVTFLKAVPDTLPLLKVYAEDNAETIAEELLELGDAWAKKNPTAKRAPKPAELAELAEKVLDKRTPKAFKEALKTKRENPEAGEKETAAKTLKGTHGTRTTPRKEPQDEHELDRQTMAELEQIDRKARA